MLLLFIDAKLNGIYVENLFIATQIVIEKRLLKLFHMAVHRLRNANLGDFL